MALQRLSSRGTIAPLALAAAAACVAGLSCAAVLGIEDASCDDSFDERCDPTRSSTGSLGIGGDGAGTGGNQQVGGTSSAGTSGAAGSAGAPAVEAPLCQRYCNTVASACTGDNEQYASMQACLAACALLDVGEDGDSSGNSVNCRLSRAELAQATGEPGSYCFSAGPGGAGVCGSNCEGFCAIMAQTCTLMGSFENCLPACAEIPNLEELPDPVTYNTSLQNGDSVQCRLYHVTAATLDPITHCSHAAGVALCTDD